MAQKTNVIWDLSGTLIKPSLAHLTEQEKTEYSLVLYMWSGKTEYTRLDKIALSILARLGQQTGSTEEIIRTHTGEPIPEIICRWLAGKVTSLQATNMALKAFGSWLQSDHNVTSGDAAIIERMITSFFDPLSLKHCMEIIPQAEQLLVLSAQNNHNSLYVCSNWDAESFKEVYDKFEPTLFTYFKRSNIVISADTGYVKPQKEIFKYLLTKHKLDPSSCFFIDDQEENIEAAKQLDIEGVRFSVKTVPEIREKLAELGIIFSH